MVEIGHNLLKLL